MAGRPASFQEDLEERVSYRVEDVAGRGTEWLQAVDHTR